MGLFDNIRKKESIQRGVDEYFKLMNAYTPAFTSFEGSVYEMDLTRAAINSFATHCSKLLPEVSGSGNEVLERKLQFKPNALMDSKKYLARLATVRSVRNTAFIVPLYDRNLNIIGYYPLSTDKCSIVTYEGKKYLRYDMTGQGSYKAIELERVGIMTDMQYRDELFGESNACFNSTMQLDSIQKQGIMHGIKNAASLRFIAKLAMTLRDEDLEKERKKFRNNNFSSDNNGGVLLLDQKYSDVKQIDSKPVIVNPAQQAQIEENVFNYFGTNKHILQNSYTPDEWQAYYEGKVEPFALEASLVHTNMTFTEHEIAFGNQIKFTANRLQYASNSEKLSIVTSLFDRGLLTRNEGREIFNMGEVEDGDKLYIRKEYAEYSEIEKGDSSNADGEGETVPSNGAEDSEDLDGTGSGTGTEV